MEAERLLTQLHQVRQTIIIDMMMMIIKQSYFEFLTLFIANDNQKKDRMKVQVFTNCA